MIRTNASPSVKLIETGNSVAKIIAIEIIGKVGKQQDTMPECLPPFTRTWTVQE